VSVPREGGPALAFHHAMFVNDLSTEDAADMLGTGGIPTAPGQLAYFARGEDGAHRARVLDDVRDLVQRLEYDQTENARALSVVGRLIVGASIELDERKSEVRTSGGKKKRTAEEPSAWTFKLTRDVRGDCRAWVGEYITGNRRSLVVQSLVRGHHKSQPHGPGNALRKWIHIEPYWRGPEDAPVAMRAHVLPDERNN
jgi:hypothetical protein